MKKNIHHGRNRHNLYVLCLIVLTASCSCFAEVPVNSSLTILANPFQYSGYYSDAESGMNYCRARYYSPEVMAFITRDSFDVPNRYGYCSGMPVKFIDPSGHSPEEEQQVEVPEPNEQGVVVQGYSNGGAIEPGISGDRNYEKYLHAIQSRHTLHFIDIDDTLISYNSQKGFFESRESYNIPQCVLESHNAILLTAGLPLEGHDQEPLAIQRREAVAKFFPKLSRQLCLSTKFLHIDDLASTADFQSKWSYIADEYFMTNLSTSYGIRVQKFTRIMLWDDNPDHLNYIPQETINKLQYEDSRSCYHVHVKPDRLELYKFNCSFSRFDHFETR